jgi:hypothetical protein
LTLDVTEKFATEAMNLLAQPVRGDAQNHDARRQPTGKPADKEHELQLLGIQTQHIASTCP